MSDTFKRIALWSGWFRLAHALIGLATLVLLASGGLIRHSPVLAQNASDLHHVAAGFLLIGVLIRIYLGFAGAAHERFSHLIPQASDWRGIWHTLRFYLLLGKTPLPRWYAHNPLWKPIYLMVYLMLLIQLATGVLMPQRELLAGFYLPSVHAYWANGLLWFVALHLLCSVWHDYASGSGDVSAMIHGHRLYFVDPASASPSDKPSSVSISVESLRKTARRQDRQP